MRSAVFIFCLITNVLSQDEKLTFIQWQIKNRVTITPIQEIGIRQKIFYQSQRHIIEHNSDPENTYEEGLNQYSHLTNDEFIEYRCGTELPQRLIDGEPLPDSTDAKKIPPAPFGQYTDLNAPNSTDFTYLMQPVLNQGICSACWAFSSMSQIEAMLKIRDSKYSTVLSPQYLLDCDINQLGCKGGWPTDTMYWLQSRFDGMNKAPTLAAYPYTSKVGICRKPQTAIPLGINIVREKYFAGNEEYMKVQIANYGPTVVAVQVTPAFKLYKSGVFYDPKCPTDCKTMNHAVLLVGYGNDPRLGDYWLVKNSWDSTWGEQGYIRMARNRGNNCNIACFAMFAQ